MMGSAENFSCSSGKSAYDTSEKYYYTLEKTHPFQLLIPTERQGFYLKYYLVTTELARMLGENTIRYIT